MKKIPITIVSLCLVLGLLTGCHNPDAELLAYIEKELQNNENVVYQSPLINLENNHVFSFPITTEVASTVDQFDTLRWNFFSVYVDETFTKEIRTYTEVTNNTLEISPMQEPLTVNHNNQVVPIHTNSQWGNYHHYYLVQYYDLQTGEKLAKPLVTIFMIEHPLETPNVSLTIEDNNYFQLDWQEVSSAKEYIIVRIDFLPFESPKATIIASTSGTSWNSMKDGGDLENPLNTFFRNYRVSKDEQYLSDDLYWWQNEESLFTGSVLGVIAINEEENSAMSYLSTDVYSPSDIVCQSAAFASDEVSIPNEVSTIDDLPTKIPVTTCDGNTSYIAPTYDTKNIAISGEILTIPYTTKNSNLIQTISVTSFDEHTYKEQLLFINQENEKMTIEPYAYQSDKIVAYDVRTSNTMPDIHDTMYSTSELETYIVANMIDGAGIIDISDYSESNDSHYIFDLMQQIRLQNPLILELADYQYDTRGVLFVQYLYDEATRKQLQQMIRDKIPTIINEIITDSMTDAEKVFAINQYICDITEYDYNALETNAYTHASTAASVFQDGLAICEGYASAFILLCEGAGLKSIMVTGYATSNSEVRHAWNRVKIDDNWYIVDPTGNDSPDTPNPYLLLSDETADSLYVEDEYYVIDTDLTKYRADGPNTYEYYRYNGQFTSVADAPAVLVSGLQKQKSYTIKIPETTSTNEIENIANQVQNSINRSFTYYWHSGVMTIVLQ